MLRWMVSGLFLLCGCTHRLCTFEGAFKECKRWGSEGEQKDYVVGGVCTDQKDLAVFQEGCDEGHALGHYWYCDISRIRGLGHKAGSSGERKSFDPSRFQICLDPNAAALEAAYDNGHHWGVEEFCSLKRLFTLGQHSGLEGKKPAFVQVDYEVCNPGQISFMRVEYEKGVDEGLREFCAVPDAEDLGLKDALNGRSRSLDVKMENCHDAERREANDRYQKGQRRGDQERCENLPIENEATKAAQDGNELVLPQAPDFQYCLKQYPPLELRFREAFAKERARIVAANCTVERGIQDGEADASTELEPKTEMPKFCDPSAFGRYMAGYFEGWRRGKDAICDPALAQQAGEQDGQLSYEVDYTPPRLCPSERHEALQREYNKSLNETRAKIHCNPDLAYQEGVRQGESGYETGYTPHELCPQNRHEAVLREYDKGLSEGRHKRYIQCMQDGRDDCSSR